jgi:hypothetical protein
MSYTMNPKSVIAYRETCARCATCREHRNAARHWSRVVAERVAMLEAARAMEGEARSRLVDHADEHPYRENRGGA